MTWYKKGQEGAEAAKAHDKEIEKIMSVPRRFWMKPDTSKVIVFLDNDGFFFREHTLLRNGKWNTHITCLNDVPDIEEECPIDFLPDSTPSYVCAFTIIDIGTYKSSRGGDPIINPKQLIILKSTARGKVLKQKERRDGNLTFCKFEVSRYGTKDVSTGSDFEFQERLTREQMIILVPKGKDPEKYLTPVKYEEAFAPMAVPDINRLLRSSGVAAQPSAVPFGSPNPDSTEKEAAPNSAESDALKSLM